MNIRRRLLVAMLGGSAVLLGAAGLVLERYTSSHLTELAVTRMAAQVRGLKSLSELSFAGQMDQVEASLRWMRAGARSRVLVGSKRIEITAIDQGTRESKTISIHDIRIDGSRPDSASDAFVDSILQRSGTDASVMALSPDGLVRLSTSVVDTQGKRANLTYIPNGSPVLDSIRKGAGYHGRTIVAGRRFLTSYAPIFDSAGTVAGALFCGIPEVEREHLKAMYEAQSTSATSYAFAFDPKGILQIHPTLDGADLADQDFVKEMLAGDSGAIRYRFKDSKTGDEGWKRAAFRKVPGLEWTVGVTDDEDAVLAVARGVRWFLLGSMGALALGILGMAVFVGRSISNPLVRAVESMEEIASGDGDLGRRLDESKKDEIGLLGGAFNRFASTISDLVGKIQNKTEPLRRSSLDLQNSAADLDQAAGETARMSTSLAKATDRLRGGAMQVSAAMDQSSSNLVSVSAAVEEMDASIREISEGTSRSRQTGMAALQVVNDAAVDMTKLAMASKEIESIVYLIGEISEQTRLLSLNATIEAARAGEAGRGFAVVATEVKDLAGEVAKASEEISAKIARMRQVSETSGEKMAKISEIMEAVAREQGSIAAAVEQQTATVREIATNLGQVGAAVKAAAKGGAEVAGTAGSVADEVRAIEGIAGSLHSQVEVVRHVSLEMRDRAGELGDLVGRFKI